MKLLILALVTLSSSQAFAWGTVHVHGYTTNNGTYVQPHIRSAPDSNPYNNYGSMYNNTSQSRGNGYGVYQGYGSGLGGR